MGRYRMTISRMTVDKLGIKLYDNVSAVVAELVANCYDADAERVRKAAVVGDADDVRDRRDSAVDLAGADLQQAPAELGRERAPKLVLDPRRATDDVEHFQERQRRVALEVMLRSKQPHQIEHVLRSFTRRGTP